MSKINIDASKFMIPTTGMKPHKPTFYSHPPANCTKLTAFYEDCGQLNWPHDMHTDTVKAWFIQTNRGVFKLVLEEFIECMFDYLDENVKATCIRCNVPRAEIGHYLNATTGAAFFIATRHPAHARRVEMLCTLHDQFDAKVANALPV